MGDPLGLFATLDVNKNGKVSLDEWLHGCQRHHGNARQLDINYLLRDNVQMIKNLDVALECLREIHYDIKNSLPSEHCESLKRMAGHRENKSLAKMDSAFVHLTEFPSQREEGSSLQKKMDEGRDMNENIALTFDDGTSVVCLNSDRFDHDTPNSCLPTPRKPPSLMNRESE